MELRAEGFRIMSSVATSIQEYLDIILDRSWDILLRKSYAIGDLDGGGSSFTLLPNAPFPEMPEKLRNAPDLKITFINPINQSQQSTELNSIDVILQTVLSTAQLNPSSLDVINFDEIIRKKAIILNLDPKIVNDDAMVEETRKGRAQAQEQQNAIANEQNKASAAKDYKAAGVPVE